MRYSSVGYFGDNRGELTNIKLDELSIKLGLTVKFGPAYSPWSNKINERNPASMDITIQKLMEDKKTPLIYALVKAAAWTHNTSINKLGYSLLQPVTGKAVTMSLTSVSEQGSCLTSILKITERVIRSGFSRETAMLGWDLHLFFAKEVRVYGILVREV